MGRLLYLDWLRVLATVAVVTIHVSAGYVTKANLDLNWFIANFLESLSRWAVPIFVMISGALLLRKQKEITIWQFFKKRTNKVLIPFISWSILFFIYGIYYGSYPPSIKNFIKLFINQDLILHFWFFYMIIGLYLITPLLKLFITNAQRKHIEYFLILWLFASVFSRFTNYWVNMKISLELNFVTDYVGYFILGYYLSNFEFNKRWRTFYYSGFFIGVLATFFLTFYFTMSKGTLDQYWYGYFSPSVVFSAAGLFILFRYYFNNRELPWILSKINKASLGIYIIHYWLMIYFLWKVFPKVETTMPTVLVIPANILLTLAISAIFTLIIKRIPIMKKLMP